MLQELFTLLKDNGIKKLNNLSNIVNMLKRYACKELLHIKIWSKPIVLNLKKLLLLQKATSLTARAN